MSWVMLLVSCVATPALAQNSVVMCGTELRLGMAKDRTLELTGRSCEAKLFPRGTMDFWCLRSFEKANSGVAAFDGCNTVRFVGGVLTEAEKEISEVPDEAAASVMSRVYAFVQGAVADRESVTVSIGGEQEFENWRYRMIYFTLRNRSLNLTISQPIGSSKSSSSVRLTESLGPPRATFQRSK
jgi:hypothetical protein